MKLLLDTHVVLWWLAGGRSIGKAAKRRIETADNVYVSIASAWEVAIKTSIGKLRLPGRFEDGVDAHGFDKLPVSFRHAEALATLPRLHGDPFDRMLIVQALTEGLLLVTSDEQITAYGVPTLTP